jgi:hypothetical protein
MSPSPALAAEKPAETPERPPAVPDAEFPLPDGIGLSLDDARTLISKEHGISLPKDEPTLFVVTLLNAFIGDLYRAHRNLLDRHEKAITSMVSRETERYFAGVKDATDTLKEGLSEASVAALQKLFGDFVAAIRAFQSNMAWLAVIVGLSAFVNVAALALRGLK